MKIIFVCMPVLICLYDCTLYTASINFNWSGNVQGGIKDLFVEGETFIWEELM